MRTYVGSYCCPSEKGNKLKSHIGAEIKTEEFLVGCPLEVIALFLIRKKNIQFTYTYFWQEEGKDMLYDGYGFDYTLKVCPSGTVAAK